MKTMDNVELYEIRKEPEVLRSAEGSYHNLRTCTDERILSVLERELAQMGEEVGEPCVVVPWLSPPYGRIVGYGIYSQSDASEIRAQSESEKWGFPRFGRSYSIEDLQERLKQDSDKDQ